MVYPAAPGIRSELDQAMFGRLTELVNSRTMGMDLLIVISAMVNRLSIP